MQARRLRLPGFVAAPLERAAPRRRDRRWLYRQLEAPQTRVLPVWRGRVFVSRAPVRAAHLSPAEAAALRDLAEAIFLGQLSGGAVFALELPEAEPALPERAGRFCDLRRVAPLLPDEDAALLAYARAMVHWQRENRFCGRCGAPTRSAEGGHVRACTDAACGAQHFPRTDPAILVRITWEDRCLLARQASWPPGRYSVIAGFVEPGETPEVAVAREAREETGLALEHIVYCASQPWPFPASLMLGFAAQAADSAIRLDDEELEDARWFDRETLEAALTAGFLGLPPPFSLSYRLIEAWFDAAAARPLRALVEGNR